MAEKMIAIVKSHFSPCAVCALHVHHRRKCQRTNDVLSICFPQVKEALVTEKKINEAREHYHPAAARASLLYFILNDLEKINPLYQFSLKVPYPTDSYAPYIIEGLMHMGSDCKVDLKCTWMRC